MNTMMMLSDLRYECYADALDAEQGVVFVHTYLSERDCRDRNVSECVIDCVDL